MYRAQAIHIPGDESCHNVIISCHTKNLTLFSLLTQEVVMKRMVFGTVIATVLLIGGCGPSWKESASESDIVYVEHMRRELILAPKGSVIVHYKDEHLQIVKYNDGDILMLLSNSVDRARISGLPNEWIRGIRIVRPTDPDYVEVLVRFARS